MAAKKILKLGLFSESLDISWSDCRTANAPIIPRRVIQRSDIVLTVMLVKTLVAAWTYSPAV